MAKSEKLGQHRCMLCGIDFGSAEELATQNAFIDKIYYLFYTFSPLFKQICAPP